MYYCCSKWGLKNWIMLQMGINRTAGEAWKGGRDFQTFLYHLSSSRWVPSFNNQINWNLLPNLPFFFCIFFICHIYKCRQFINRLTRGALNSCSGKDVRPRFLKCVACQMTFTSEIGVLWTKIFQFGRLWAKILVKIESVNAKISKFFSIGVLWTDF